MNEDTEKMKEKIIAEIQKRKEIVAEANIIVQSLERHYQDRKMQENINVERNKVINQIHDIVKQKDIGKLDDLLERLG